MTIAAEIYRLASEGRRPGILNCMRWMTIGTYRYIKVIILNQGFPMHTLNVLAVDVLVTLLTGRGNFGSGLIGLTNVVSAMAIST